MEKKSNPVKEKLFPECPIRNVLVRISDKWSLLVLYTLHNQPGAMRFSRLQREIPDISQKMLTNTLRTLEEDGFVRRKAYAEIPPRVEYSLTPRALSLLPCINILIDWAENNRAAILKDRQSRREKTIASEKEEGTESL